MPIKSYIAYPVTGKKAELEQSLQVIPPCEVIPSPNQDIIILVTDTGDEDAETDLVEKLSRLSSLQCLTLVSCFKDPI